MKNQGAETDWPFGDIIQAIVIVWAEWVDLDSRLHKAKLIGPSEARTRVAGASVDSGPVAGDTTPVRRSQIMAETGCLFTGLILSKTM